MNNYENITSHESIIAYFDILGYKNMMAEACQLGNQNLLLLTLKKCIKTTDTFQFREYGYHVFSDNFIKGISINNLNAYSYYLIEILTELSAIQCNFINANIFIRGAITQGNYYQDKDFVFGKSVIDAYIIESQTAIYPRIVIEDICLDNFCSRSSNYTNLELHKKRIITDVNGISFVNYLAFAIENNNLIFIKEHKNRIWHNIKQAVNESIREKYIWLAGYHNFICEEHNLIKEIIPNVDLRIFNYLKLHA